MNELTAREKIFKALNLCIPALMGLFIFLNPFPFTTAAKEICFYSSVVMILILACFRKLDFSFQSPLTIPFILFALWAFIGLFFALDRANSIHDYQTHFLKYVAFYFILINYFRSRERLYFLSLIIISSAALFSIGEIVYFYGILGHSLSTKLVTGLTEVAVNWVGIIVIPAAIFSLHNMVAENRRNVKAVSAICLLSSFAICILTQARSTVLALFLSIMILCFKNKKIMIACLGIVLLFTMTTSIKDRFTQEDPILALRLGTHYITYEVIKDYPLMGVGFGMETYGNGKYIDLEAYSKRIPEQFRGHIYTDPHSMPFSIAVRTGLIGFVLFLYILFMTFKMGWISIRKGKDDQWGRRLISAFVAILVIGLFEPFFSHVPEVVFFTMLAMITIVWRWGDDRAYRKQGLPV